MEAYTSTLSPHTYFLTHLHTDFTARQGCIFSVWQKYDQITCVGKKLSKSQKWIKEGGKMHIFPPIVKTLHIFSPIKLYKIAQKRLKIFSLRRAQPHYNKIHLGKKYQSRKGGGDMNFKFNIHPCCPYDESHLKLVQVPFFFTSKDKFSKN